MPHEEVEGKGLCKDVIFVELGGNAHGASPVFCAQDVPVKAMEEDDSPFGEAQLCIICLVCNDSYDSL